MTFNTPIEQEFVSTDVTNDVDLFDPDNLYVKDDESRYDDDILTLTEDVMINLEEHDSAEAYNKGEIVTYGSSASALERAVSQAINVPLTDSATYTAPTWEELIEPNYMIELDNYSESGLVAATGIAVSRNVAYVVSYTADSITAIDISDPNNMFTLDSYTSVTLDTANGIAISGNVAYVVSANQRRITSIDISDPSTLVELDSLLSTTNLNGAIDIAISENVAYVVSNIADSITSIDISDPSTLAELDSYTSANLNGASGIAISGTVAYVANRDDNSITSINIATPGTLAELNSYTSSNLSSARNIAISGSVAYVASYTSDSITSINISNPSALAELDSYTSTNLNGAYGIDILGDVAYVTGLLSNKVTAIDISNSSDLAEIDSVVGTSMGEPRNIAIAGDIAYIVSFATNNITSIDVPTNPFGIDVGIYNFSTTYYATHLDVTITLISTSTEVQSGELYNIQNDHVTRYYGTGCPSSCGTDRLVYLEDGNVYIFTAEYTHTNGAIAADFRDLGIVPYGFSYVRPARTALPLDSKQYTSVIESGTQTWKIKGLTTFDGVALGRLRGTSVTVVFKDSSDVTISTVTDKAIDGSIDANIVDEPISDVIYCLVDDELTFIEANGTIEVTISGSETELGMIFPTASISVGMTMLDFSHDIKNFDRTQVSAISGYVDHITGNRVVQHKGSFQIEMIDYDKMVLLNKKLSQELIAVDGSDMTDNSVADGENSFASTKLICRVKQLKMKSTIDNGGISDYTPIAFEFEEIV